MQVLIDNFGQITDGFIKTLWLLVFSGTIAAVLGTFLAALRVSPIGPMRLAGTSYINVFRNTPLLLILLLILNGAPDLGFTWEPSSYFNYFFVCATIGLGLYAAAFVCEALRSGINAIPLGQAEAARAIGMTFSQAMTSIILPQAFRAVIPPLTSTYIALAKNTSVVAIFGVPDAAYVMRKLSNQYATDLWAIFFGIALGYVVIVAVIATASSLLERRLAVSR